MAAALSALPRAAARLALRGGCRPPFRALCAAAPSPAPRRLVLYTKPGCCLCDGLKEKLRAASLLTGTPYSLASLELQASKRGTSRRIRSGSGCTSTRSRCSPRCFPTAPRKYFPDYRPV
ncbi:uncharacterized protein LOC133919881 isoform X2 [Phragmites australis]|uniref:uncharacterized protein LOC133919881 isoform X2 n=1 Tax=Phragmites australis TaxID=29695 RepID=UPI002D799F6B|nr:uncharacterized protein LOC133919881 isoform X2 [Phragmites australis]